MALPEPTHEELLDLGEDTAEWKRESASRVLTAVGVVHGEITRFGVAESTLVENKFGFGQTSYLTHEEQWFDTIDELGDALAVRVGRSRDVVLAPEPGSRPWVDVMFFLTNRDKELELPGNWTRHLEVLGGLYGVKLEVHRNVSGGSRSILNRLQSDAPAGLLISKIAVPDADSYVQVYRKARTGGYVSTVGGDGTEQFSEYVTEIGWHLRDFRLFAEPKEIDEKASWDVIGPLVLELRSSHFVLTDRAIASLAANPYPKPKRMYDHLRGLEELAKRHFDNRRMPGGIADAARAHAIEVALFDGRMPPKVVEHCDAEHSTEPHVKVDDFKSPAECGRVYFAVDTVCGAFIVDHIGLHDYY